MEVNRGTILDAIEAHQLKTIEEVGDVTEAGTFCGSCHDDIEDILKDQWG